MQTEALKRWCVPDTSGNTANTAHSSSPPLPEHTCQPCELARTQAGRQAHRRARHLASCEIPSGPTSSAEEHQPRATGFKDAVATSAGSPGGCQPPRPMGERGRKVWQLWAGCTNVQLLVGLLWFPHHPQRQRGLGVLPTQMMLPASKGRPAGGVTSWPQPSSELGSMEERGSRGTAGHPRA